MRIITGDDTGLIKQILIENKRIVTFLAMGVMCSSGGERRVGRTEWSAWRGLARKETRKTSWASFCGTREWIVVIGLEMDMFKYGTWTRRKL